MAINMTEVLQVPNRKKTKLNMVFKKKNTIFLHGSQDIRVGTRDHFLKIDIVILLIRLHKEELIGGLLVRHLAQHTQSV